jgi:hypothetical protein
MEIAEKIIEPSLHALGILALSYPIFRLNESRIQ